MAVWGCGAMLRKPGMSTELYGSAAGGGVYLRHPGWTDFEDWVALRRDNKPHLSPWEPEWNDRHLTRPAYRSKLSRFKRMVTAGEGYPFYIYRADDQRLVGACNITHIERNVAQSAKLGYWVGEAYTRQGIARAAVSAAVRFCFEDLGLHRIEAAVRPENTPSIKVLEVVGFRPEGMARGYLKIDGQWQDHQIFSKLSSD